MTTAFLQSPLSASEIVFFLFATAIITVLSNLLWRLGREASKCPVSGGAALGATIAIVGAYASIAFGLVALVGALGAGLTVDPLKLGLAQIGAAALIAGIGFSIAASTLRDSLAEVLRQSQAMQPSDQG